MGLIFSKEEASGNFRYKVGVWDITESIDLLLTHFPDPEKMKLRLRAITNEGRKLEILGAGALACLLTGEKDAEIEYRKNVPVLKNSGFHISLSHSGRYIAAVISKNSEIGVDIEEITPRIGKIAHRFLSEGEKRYLKQNASLEQLYVIWCAKESLFKLYRKGGLIFSKDILIDPFDYRDSGVITAALLPYRDGRKLKLHYFKINSFILVYCANGIRSKHKGKNS